jgi:hypothetical protein
MPIQLSTRGLKEKDLENGELKRQVSSLEDNVSEYQKQ